MGSAPLRCTVLRPSHRLCVFWQNRELQIMKMLDHVNVTTLHNYFYTEGEKVSVPFCYEARAPRARQSLSRQSF